MRPLVANPTKPVQYTAAQAVLVVMQLVSAASELGLSNHTDIPTLSDDIGHAAETAVVHLAHKLQESSSRG
jgi:hypothetical protein